MYDKNCYNCQLPWIGCEEHKTGFFHRPNITVHEDLKHLFDNANHTQESPDGNVYIISPCGELKGIMLHTPQRFIKNVTHLEKCLSLES